MRSSLNLLIKALFVTKEALLTINLVEIFLIKFNSFKLFCLSVFPVSTRSTITSDKFVSGAIS